MKRTFLLLLTVILSTVMMAGNVTPEQALEQARNFMQKREANGIRPRRGASVVQQFSTAKQVSGLYVFNIANNGGFVIVSNDDRTTPILGYADSGNLDSDNMPENMKAWLEGYAKEIKFIQTNGESGLTKATRRSARTTISALLSTTWGQHNPFRLYCPIISGEQCVTGCVATAMAQVMKYQADRQGITTTTTADIPIYTLTDAEIAEGAVAGAAVPSKTITWGNMANHYNTSGNSTITDENRDVATLMQCCGASVKMAYNVEAKGGSGASLRDVPYALYTYFGYPHSMVYRDRSYYLLEEWEDMLYSELSNNRPVIYAGNDPSHGGHAFVIDGYDASNGTYHVNWGWYGTANGNFVLTLLNPTVNSTTYNFINGQDAVFGIDPSGTVVSETLMASEVTTVEDGGTKIQATAFNFTGVTHNFDFSFGFLGADNSITAVTSATRSNIEINNNYGKTYRNLITSIMSGQPAGTYKVVAISRVSGESEWQISGSASKYVEIIWDGSAATSIQQYPCCAFYDKAGNLISRSTDAAVSVPAGTCYVDLSKFDCTSITPNSNPNTLYYLGANQHVPTGIVSKNFINGNTTSTITLSENGDFYVPKAFTATTVNYARTLTAGSDAYTVCLPYAPPTTIGITYYTLSAVSGTTLTFIEVASPAANTPYLAIPSSNVSDLGATGAEFAVTSINTPGAVDNYQLQGTLAGMTNAEAAAANAYILQAGNIWGKVKTDNPGAIIPPFRAYITSTSPSRELSSNIGGEGITGINNIRAIDNDGTEHWFDLNGRRINGIPSQKGIYVNKGRKVIIK